MDYYTPEISEFHVGFEYEVYASGPELAPWKWHKRIAENIPPFAEGDIEGMCRVKYLDRKDIESEGFKSDRQEGHDGSPAGFYSKFGTHIPVRP